MTRIKVAHIREQGQDMLLFPLDGGVHQKPDSEKQHILDDLEDSAHAAGLGGTAAILWDHGGRTYSFGPRQWAPFLRSISTRWVLRNVNREISW